MLEVARIQPTSTLFRLCALCDLCGEFSSGPRPPYMRRPHHRRERRRNLRRQKVEKKRHRPQRRGDSEEN